MLDRSGHKRSFDLDKFLGCKDVFNSAVHPPGSDSTHVVHVKEKVSPSSVYMYQ